MGAIQEFLSQPVFTQPCPWTLGSGRTRGHLMISIICILQPPHQSSTFVKYLGFCFKVPSLLHQELKVFSHSGSTETPVIGQKK